MPVSVYNNQIESIINAVKIDSVFFWMKELTLNVSDLKKVMVQTPKQSDVAPAGWNTWTSLRMNVY